VAAKSVAAANTAAVSKAADDKPCPSVNKRREATPAVFLSVRGAQVRRSSAAIISVNLWRRQPATRGSTARWPWLIQHRQAIG
jgi:hypothetical protein